MAAISEIPLSASGNGRRRVHLGAGQAPRLNAALIRGPLQHIDGANAYQFVGSDPVGMVDAESEAGFTNSASVGAVRFCGAGVLNAEESSPPYTVHFNGQWFVLQGCHGKIHVENLAGQVKATTSTPLTSESVIVEGNQ